MASTVWKVTAIKQWSEIAKGMVVEIAISNRTGKPYMKEIAESLVRKYGIKDLTASGMPENIFTFEKQ